MVPVLLRYYRLLKQSRQEKIIFFAHHRSLTRLPNGYCCRADWTKRRLVGGKKAPRTAPGYLIDLDRSKTVNISRPTPPRTELLRRWARAHLLPACVARKVTRCASGVDDEIRHFAVSRKT